MRVGVFPFSLSATLASVAGSSCSNVLWANRVQSCLSVSLRLWFLGSFCSSFLSCWRLFSILVTSSSFVLMAVVSNERSASYSPCLLLRLPPSPPASFSPCLLLRLPPSPPASLSACLLLRLPPSLPASFSACLLLRLPPSPPASFSACHNLWICSLSGSVPGNDSLIFILNAFGTTCLSLRLLRFARFVFSGHLLVCVCSIAWQPKTEVCTIHM